ncbi:MAG: NAD-dependent DNA ligase LigA [Phycisphaerae bacterium]|nr:NAD-dependent DNA ligase LigA [Phycisphaerae bacterium]
MVQARPAAVRPEVPSGTSMPPSPADRAARLRALLHRANRAYYVDTEPIMSDAEYDRLLQELGELEAAHPELADPDSPTQRVGGEPIEGFRTVAHAVPMLSIDNTYDAQGLRDWAERCSRGLGGDGLFERGEVAFVCDPKIDGVALTLRYEQGRLARAVTRGDGARGDDVTHAARAIRAIPLVLEPGGARRTPGPPRVLEVRGEVYFPLKEFARVNARREREGEDLFMNPRNAAAGTLKQLDPALIAPRRLAFSAWGRGEVSDGFAESHWDYLEKLRALGVPVSPHAARFGSIDETLAFIADFEGARASLDYAVDGVVVRLDRFDQQRRLGVTAKSPRWIVAYKYAAQRSVTRLLRVDHQVGKTGKITPRAAMEPVVLAGTTVRHATLHNYGRVRDAVADTGRGLDGSGERTDIRVGDTVYVEKAGEVIPQVVGVLLSERSRGARPIEPPDRCPVCSGPVEVEPPEAAGDPALETARRCVNPECPAQVREKLIWFAGRKQMDIEGLGEKTVDQIRAAGAIPLDAFADVFRLREHRDRLLALERMGEKKVDNLLEGIERAKSRGLARVLAGMGIRHVGDATARALARQFKDLDDLLAAPEPRLRPKTLNDAEARAWGLPEKTGAREETGLGLDTAPAVYAYLHSPQARKTFRDLAALGVDLSSHDYRPPSARGGEGPMAGRTVVITGTLEHFERDDLKGVLELLGAKVTDSVSGKTTLLVVGASPGSKLDKARELGIEAWDEPRLLKELKRMGAAPP